MSSGWIIFLEFSGVVGVVVGLGGWELWRLRREQARDAQRRRDEAGTPRTECNELRLMDCRRNHDR